MEIHHKKWKNIYVYMMASHFSPAQKQKIFKIDPTVNVII